MSEDNVTFIPIFVVVIFLCVLGYMLGFTMAEKKIYNNCLENNGSMIHSEAVAKCREIVK